MSEAAVKYRDVTQYFLNRFGGMSGHHVVGELRSLAAAEPAMTVADLVAELERQFALTRAATTRRRATVAA